MVTLDKHLPKEVRALFEMFTANDIVEMFEELDMLIHTEELKEVMGLESSDRYFFASLLLRKAIRALEPPTFPVPGSN
jgi:hypothetical protein